MNSIKVKLLNFIRNLFKIRALETWLAAKTLNKMPHSLVCKLVPNPYQYARGTYRKIDRNGLILQVDISDYIGHYLYFGFLDPSIIKLFSLCNKNFNVIDIGTNIGWVALNLAKLSQGGHVVGFEPDPFNYQVCKNNIDRNRLANLIILPYGLGETPGQVNMEVRTPDNRGGNRVAPKDSSGAIAVQIKRLDDVREVSSLPTIHLMKLDVEGYELKVLRGALNLLKKHKPILFIEVDDDNLKDQNDSAKDLLEFLELNGYTSIYNAETSEKIVSSTSFTHCHFDIIAT